MRIAVDARELCHRPTGVGRYLRELLIEWARMPEAHRHDWMLYAPSMPLVDASWAARVRPLPGAGGSVWEQWTLRRALEEDRPDVLFAPGYSAPIATSVPVALTVHDVSFFAHPEWFSAREGVRRRALTRWSARRARVVLTDSEFSRAELCRFLHLPRSAVRVIRLGMRAPSPSAAAREPVVLYAGSVFERRRVDWLIQAFDLVAQQLPSARLEIVGENRTAKPRIDLDAARRQTACADRITIQSYVDEATLRDLYARASVFAFLSEYEGFGLTPLEALAAGVPPVVLDTFVAREICGPAARYVPAGPRVDRPLVEAMVDLLTTPSCRQAVLAHAPQVLARYDWTVAAAATLAAIEEAADAR